MVVTSLKNYQQNQFVKKRDGLVFVDECGIIYHSNQGVKKLFGLSNDMLFKKNIAVLFTKDFSKKIYTCIYRCISNEKIPLKENYLGISKNSKEIPLNISFKKYNYLGVQGVLLRLSKIDNQIAKNKKSLLNEYKEHAYFVSKTSHELRNPLTTILNATTILEKIQGDLKYKDIHKKNIRRIKKSISQLTHILDDFLTINKIESTQQDQPFFETNVKVFTKKIIESLQGENSKNILIDYQHVGQTSIQTHRDMLYSVLTNLLSNAIKYSFKNGSVQFKTEVIDDNRLQIICKDKGIGIPLDEQKKLFKRYYRAKNVTHIQGTGLGLSIVKEHIDSIGGTISFKSVQNIGTTFVIILPIKTIVLEHIS